MVYKNVLVTGGSGFIGSNFINLLLKKYSDSKIINLDLLTYAGSINNTRSFEKNENYFFYHGNINDNSLVKKIFKTHKIDAVINFAAESHVDNSIIDPDSFINTNINGTYNLLKCCYEFWMNSPHNVNDDYKHARFHQISTDEVYGSLQNHSADEKFPYNPNSPYSASKASADMIVRSFNVTYGLNTTISLSSNNFGPNQNIEKFIPKVIHCLKKNLPIPVYGDGKNIRDWIFVEDNCEAIDKILNFANSGEKFNVGGNNEFTNLEIIDKISMIIKNKPNVKFVDDRFGHDIRYSLNTKKIDNLLGYRIGGDFEKKLKKFINNIT